MPRLNHLSPCLLSLSFMKNDDVPKLSFFFKGFPEDLRFRRHTVPESLLKAKGSLYEAWYRSIKLSPYLAAAKETGLISSDGLFEMHHAFGDLSGTTFESWWVSKGYELFREKGDYAKISVCEDQSGSAIPNTLLLEIPLNVSPATLKLQFDDLLEKHHEHYKKFDRLQHNSTAMLRMHATKFSSASINMYLDVYEKWQELLTVDSSVNLYTLGELMNLNPQQTVKQSDLPAEVKDKHQKMSLTVSEYLKKAKNLIANASDGRFPCTDHHEWVERASRASNWRHSTD